MGGTYHFLKFTAIAAIVMLFWSSCQHGKLLTEPVKTEIIKTENGFELLRSNNPHFIKGARTIGVQYMDKVAAAGGNSIRIGSGGNIQEKLDEANRHGLSVLFGLPMEAERNGFDYSDKTAVKQQFEEVKSYVEEFKDHPAILMWAIGNELDYVPDNPDYNQKVWDAVNDIAVMIHKVDPNHPAITVVGTGRKEKLQSIKKKLPDIDALGINSYGDIYEIPLWLAKYNYNKPYVITEWGPTGHWQVPQNQWGLPIEETSTEKAALYMERHQEVIAANPDCLGGYSFLWTGGRQERTHTWYNMFYDEGEEKEALDVMQFVWTGNWPDNKAPKIDRLFLDGKSKDQNIELEQGERYSATVFAHDPNKDTLIFEWEIYPENIEFGYAGHGEERPQVQQGLIDHPQQQATNVTAPGKPGNYRLFVYVRDDKNKIAVANIPFHVK